MQYRRLLRFIPIVLLATLISCETAVEVNSSVEEALMQEQQRIEYLTTGAYDQLEQMSSPTMTYTHSSSVMDTRDEFMADLRSGLVTYLELVHDDVSARLISPDAVMIHGNSDVLVNIDGEDLNVPLRFTMVYVRDGDQWLFETWHSTRR